LTKQQEFLEELNQYFWENNLIKDPLKLERLSYFAYLVVKKNEEINLISRKDVNNIIENHVFLSAFISQYIPDKASNFIDIGTGGGFPGIPVAIMNPLLKGVLVDSTTKKIKAVEEFINKLKLYNITAENSRVEDKKFVEKHTNMFNLVISRATVPLVVLIRYALPVIQERATLISIKGGDLQSELKTAEIKYKSNIHKSTIYELAYKPTNSKNEKGKKLITLELTK
jgi:16S rRNA (guanine527-N7)-methyltransferase